MYKQKSPKQLKWNQIRVPVLWSKTYFFCMVRKKFTGAGNFGLRPSVPQYPWAPSPLGVKVGDSPLGQGLLCCPFSCHCPGPELAVGKEGAQGPATRPPCPALITMGHCSWGLNNMGGGGVGRPQLLFLMEPWAPRFNGLVKMMWKNGSLIYDLQFFADCGVFFQVLRFTVLGT